MHIGIAVVALPRLVEKSLSRTVLTPADSFRRFGRVITNDPG